MLQRFVCFSASLFPDHLTLTKKGSKGGGELVTVVAVKETTPAFSTVKGS
jgi:hypothetical protein